MKSFFLNILILACILIPSISFGATPSIFDGINIWEGATCNTELGQVQKTITKADGTTTTQSVTSSIRSSTKIGHGEGPQGPCDFCDAIIIASNVMRYAFELIFFILFPLFFAWGGIQFMLSSGNPGKVKQAKQILMSAVIGLVIAAASWLIVGAVLKALIGFSGGTMDLTKWQNISC